MKISQSNIHATKLSLHDNQLNVANYQIDPQYYKKITPRDNNTYQLSLSAMICNTEQKPFPLDLEVVFEVTFKLDDAKDQKEIDDFLNINAIQMVFPFMRAAINSLTSAALMPPLVIPIIDVRQFKEI